MLVDRDISRRLLCRGKGGNFGENSCVFSARQGMLC